MAERKEELEYLQRLGEMEYFSRDDLFRVMNQCGVVIGEHGCRARVERLLSTGKIVRIGRNAYCVAAPIEHGKQKRKKQAGRALGTEVRIAVEGYTKEKEAAEGSWDAGERQNIRESYERNAAGGTDNMTVSQKKGNRQSLMPYRYRYSGFSEEVAARIREHHPYVEFTILELQQLNEFLKHSAMHNIIFISAKSDLGDFLFHTLSDMYPGNVLLHPTIPQLCRYYADNLLVIEKQISEAPAGKTAPWHTRLEKLLVDIRTGKRLPQLLYETGWEEQDWVHVYEKAFERYGVDESCLFRYAKRRAAETKIREFIETETKIQLRLPKQGQKQLNES